MGLYALALPTVHALRTVPGSPCTSVCGVTTNTTSSEISCVDSAYNTTTTGESFKSCVSCLLASPFDNTTSGETDVDWGLYNLRYAFTSCVYDYPVEVTNVSTPCLVSCTSLGPALELQLTDPVDNQLDSFCSSTSFADNVVDTCEACYALTEAQAFLANFLEAIRYNCHFPTSAGVAFPIAATRIFNATELPTTTVAYSSTATSTGESMVHKLLTVVIIVPIVGFLIIVGLTVLCCFCCVRHRRKLAKKRRQQNNNRWATGAFNAAWQPAWSVHPGSPYQQQFAMQSATPFGTTIPGKGFEVVEYDGKTYEAGYSTQYVSPISEEQAARHGFQFNTDATGADTKGPVVTQHTEIESQTQNYYPPGAPHAL